MATARLTKLTRTDDGADAWTAVRLDGKRQGEDSTLPEHAFRDGVWDQLKVGLVVEHNGTTGRWGVATDHSRSNGPREGNQSTPRHQPKDARKDTQTLTSLRQLGRSGLGSRHRERSDKPPSSGGAGNNVTQAGGDEFLPPYTFVELKSDPEREDWADLLDRAGHERFSGLCGRISCEIDVLTPLFIPDAEGQKEWCVGSKDTDVHRQKRFFRVGDVPCIPPASLKGPIRSVFEALTNSCLGVFEPLQHQTKLNRPWGLQGKYDKTVIDATPGAWRPDACKAEGTLCSACALFGGAFEGPGEAADASLAGRVAFGVGWPVGGCHQFHWLPLRILGEPHLTYFPFYLSPHNGQVIDYDGKTWLLRGRKPRQQRGTLPGAVIRVRGRKFYWHQVAKWQDEEDDQWTPYELEPQHVGRIKDASHRKHSRTNQNATVELLKPGVKFRFSVDFENLSCDELKLLVWCLGLQEGMAHHFGMGKPIGLGSCRVTVKHVSVRDLTTSYTSLCGNDEKVWDKFDPERRADLIMGVTAVSPDALRQLSHVLALEPFGSETPHIDYTPPGCLANKGFEYYVRHRHVPLVTVDEAVDGKRMVANNMQGKGS